MASKTAVLESSSSKSVPQIPAISYRLSEKYFLGNGWTNVPHAHSTIPVVVMKAKFANAPISPWFQRRTCALKKNYSNGSTAFLANSNGTGEIYYPNGKLAVKIEKVGVSNMRTRIWIYSSGEPEPDGERHPHQLCALFDSLGNGVVYDARLRKRLVYNQTEGILWDTPGGVPVLWRWHNFRYQGSEEDDKDKIISESPKRGISVLLPDTKTAESGELAKATEVANPSQPSPTLNDSESELREEMEQALYVDTSKLVPKTVGPLKPIVLRINQHLALRIFSQSEISLRFFTRTHRTTLKIGVLYNPINKLKVVEVEKLLKDSERVYCAFEDFPPNTKSMLSFRKFIRRIREVSSCAPHSFSV